MMCIVQPETQSTSTSNIFLRFVHVTRLTWDNASRCMYRHSIELATTYILLKITFPILIVFFSSGWEMFRMCLENKGWDLITRLSFWSCQESCLPVRNQWFSWHVGGKTHKRFLKNRAHISFWFLKQTSYKKRSAREELSTLHLIEESRKLWII